MCWCTEYRYILRLHERNYYLKYVEKCVLVESNLSIKFVSMVLKIKRSLLN